MSVNSILYSNGVASMLGQKLFAVDKFNRLAESGNLASAVKILYETGYGGGITIGNPTDYIKILDAEMNIAVDFYKYHCVDSNAKVCFLTGYDYLNCKLLYKAIRMNRQVSNQCNKYGLLTAEQIDDCIRKNDCDCLPGPMHTAIDMLNTQYVDVVKPATIDIVFDRAMYEDIVGVASRCTSPQIEQYYRLKVDFINILSAFRCAKARLCADKYRELIIDCGNLSAGQLMSCYSDNTDAIMDNYRQLLVIADPSGIDTELRYYRQKDYLDLCRMCVQALTENKSFCSAEVLAFNRCKDVLQPHKSELNTILPFITYFLSKTTEIDNVKMVLTCIANNVDSALIKLRLKELYV